jgi:hypothetical protein
MVLAASLALVCGLPTAEAQLLEDFDGGGTTPFELFSTSGTAPEVMAGGPTGSFLRLTHLNGSNNNSVAFDEELSISGPAPLGFILSFDFRMSDDQANADAGGCCGSAADGLGIGFFATSTYGTTGALNPAVGGAGDWERPAFADAVSIGLDVFQNIDVVTLNALDLELAAIDVQPFLDLNNGLFHRATLRVVPDPGDPAAALLHLDIVEDVHGAAIDHSIIAAAALPLDLSTLPGSRIIAGGRTGGAFVAGDIDNVRVSVIPEPGSIALLALAAACAVVPAVRRRRGCA